MANSTSRGLRQRSKPRRQPQGSASRDQRSNQAFPIPSDNEGTAAWRSNQKPAETIRLPLDASVNRERINKIAADTGTHVQITRRELSVWGNGPAAAQAKSLIDIEIANTHPSFTSGKNPAKWAKTPSLTPEARRIYEKELDRTEATEEYRRDPMPDAVFETIGNLVWPSDVASPHDVFGRNLQVLDPIRSEHSCHIIFDHSLSSFQAMGKKQDVTAAIVRVRTALFQVIARQVEPSKTYMLHHADPQRVPAKVDVIEHDPVKTIVTSRAHQATKAPLRTPRAQGKLLKAGNSKLLNPTVERFALATKVKDQVMSSLNKIKYYRGSITLQARLGTMILERYQKVPQGGYDLAAFEAMLANDSAFNASVTQELGNEQLEQTAYERLTKAAGYLEPQSTFIERLEDVRPTFTATLTLDADAIGSNFIQLSKVWQEIDNDFVVLSGPSFYRLEQEDLSARCIMATCVLNVGDGMSWAIEMLARIPIEKESLKTELYDLGNYYFNIKEREARDVRGKDVWCEFEKKEDNKPRLVARKKMLELRTSWEHAIVNTRYVVEITKFQQVKYDTTDKAIAGKEEATVYEPRWTLQMKHRDWDRNLAENSNLAMGKGASWRTDLDTWFPRDEDSDKEKRPGAKPEGHVQMLDNLFRLQDIIRGE
ncbi:hypothetical protein AAFC00_005367 [Neodothiora populina]|uniref:DUF7905 domain-containing protein n=1 Tax=Neodothiora populina TaxID=2781224 RepID=A0ABR3PKU5_9PEZI